VLLVALSPGLLGSSRLHPLSDEGALRLGVSRVLQVADGLCWRAQECGLEQPGRQGLADVESRAGEGPQLCDRARWVPGEEDRDWAAADGVVPRVVGQLDPCDAQRGHVVSTKGWFPLTQKRGCLGQFYF